MATIKMTKKDWSYGYYENGDKNHRLKASDPDNTYIPYESALEKYTSLDFDLSGSINDYFVKSGNDLVIYSLFDSGKIVTNTVKDYFKFVKKGYNFVVVSQTGDWMNDCQGYDYISSNLASSETSYGTIVDSDSVNDEVLFGTSKNDSYSIDNEMAQNSDGKDYVYDLSGNDNYRISARHVNASTGFVEVHDFKGNDTYDFGNTTYAKIYESKGNDTYKSSDISAVIIEDSQGKDTYIFRDSSYFVVTDKNGNDKYLVCDAGIIRYGEYSQITDLKGNDSYELIKSKHTTITDNGGNDKYTLTAGHNTTINESAGKDTYNLTAEESVIINDHAGNDKYNFKFVNMDDYANIVNDSAGNDKYNISYSDYITFNDERGSDSYVLNDSTYEIAINDNGTAEKVGKKVNKKLANDKYTLTNSNATITEKEGADTYKLTSSGGNITDNGGNDKYTVSGYKAFLKITDKTASKDTYKLKNTTISVEDDGGKDSYNVSASSAIITDKGQSSKDSYTVDMKGSVTISDDGGSGDTLKLNGAKKGNLVFMVDYSKYAKEGYEGYVDSGNLIIFDKTTNGFVEIKDYFSMESSYIRYTNADRIKPATYDGCIETIYAGKTNVTKTMFSQLTGANVEAISADVATWLTDGGRTYDSVSDLLSNRQSADLAEFIATFVQQ